jgi:solute carrier family 15 (peptide/histidine transporter), member 3/4
MLRFTTFNIKKFRILTLEHASCAEFSECLASAGVGNNLIVYLTSVLHESNVDAAKHASTWTGTCFFTPLMGAFLADSYWGRYWTVVIFTSIFAVVSN